ncbi:hypothetical protein GOP47_0008938 [Adiantum capillus-veneris]|uniref:Pentatricopeptide repeat-containing protein n=1 Tax=Adiantum capillus-veneris TaxID=13818 RepID=A0A9D4UZH8_ADICA|nr:hypothetical protein GOP47_0008938 [Adiantum capillus-veneris]
MAATIPQLRSCVEVEEDFCSCKDLLWKDNRNSKPSPRHAPINHDITVLDSWCHASHDHGSVRHRESPGQASHGTLSAAQINSCIASLKACTRNKDLVKGIGIHHDLAQKGLLEECSDSLVTLYANCGELGTAKALLDMHSCKDVVAWTALIAGYAREGQGYNALDCFEQMQCLGILPNSVTYVCTLKACATIKAIDKGKQIHDEIVQQGLLRNDIVLGGALLGMYAKCGAISKARRVLEELPFRNAVCWSALIVGYVQEGQAERALECFEQMQQEGILPDAVTYICALNACAMMRAAERGRRIHKEIVMQGLLQNNIVLGGALVDMYAKCGAVSEAQHALQKLPWRNVISWNALIAGYVQKGEAEQALNCLEQMQREGICPNAVTYASALRACAIMRTADRGKEIHDEIARQGLLQNNVVLGNVLVDMYAKCSDLSEAQRVFDELPSRDVVSWNTLIAGYAQEGAAQRALNCFEEMQSEGMRPNAATCASVLNVHNHQGLVEEGQALFLNMSVTYGVKPSLECYTCMIDLLGRAGHLDKAVKLIQEMPSSDRMAIWHTLLGLCQNWADVKVGEWAFEQALKLDNRDGSAYVFMGNIYAAAGMEEKAKNIEAMRIRNKAWEKPRHSWQIGSL